MPTTQEVNFGTMLIEQRIATQAQVKECFAIQTRLPQPAHLGAIMVKKGYLSEHQARQLLSMVQTRRSHEATRNGHSNGHSNGYQRNGPPTGAMVRPIQAQAPDASGVRSPAASGVMAPPQNQDAVNVKLGQLLIQRGLLSRENAQQALAQTKQYQAAGHSVSLAQVLVQNFGVNEGVCRQLLQDASITGQQNPSGVHNPMASGPFNAAALQQNTQNSCPSCGARVAAQNRCPACGSPIISHPAPAQDPNGSGFHQAMAPGGHAPSGYRQAPMGPPPSGPHSSGQMAPMDHTPTLRSRPQSGPVPQIHSPMPHAMAPGLTPGMNGGMNGGLNPSGPVPIFGVDSQSVDPHYPASASNQFQLVGDPVPSGPNSSGKMFNPSNPSGNQAPIETCISPDDPIAQKMPTVKKPDGSYEIVFGPYDILGEVARGGMGIVYRARQRDLKRVVALKVMKDGENASEKQIRRFRRETEAAAKLQHPNIVAVHEVGCIEGFHFFTMDLIEGDPLDIRIKRGERPPLKEAATIVKEVSQAIHYAHGKKIVHRDLKPANILMDLDGHPKVTDFGLAKNVDHKSMLTRTGAVVGTPYSMPPEQARGDTDIDARCDVYALGVILYELMTGKLPFRGETTMEVYHKILEEDPISPRQHNSRIPRDAEVICLKAMDKERHRRYQTCKDLAEDLQRFYDGEPIKARPLGVFGKVYRKARKNQAAVLVGTAAVCVLSLCFSFFVHRYFERQQHDYYVKARHEWDNYTSELENQLITARSSISAASAKIKEKNSQNAIQDLEESRRILGRLPLLINNQTKFNSRARAGLYLICLDSTFRNKLFEGDKPKKSPDIEGFLADLKTHIEESEIFTDEKTPEDDPFGEVDDTVYFPCTAQDVQDFLSFVESSSVDLGEGGQDLQAYRVESAMPAKDLRHFYRDIYRERGHAFRLREDELGYKKALSAYKKALEYDSNSKEALTIRLEIGKVLAASGDLEKSLSTLKALIAEAPNFTPAYLERGHIYDRLKRFKEAVKDYSQVIDKDFEPIGAYLARGRTFMKVGLFSKALNDFEEVIEHKDDSFWGYLERGRAHMVLGNSEEAESDLTEAIDLNASLPHGYASRAELLFRLGKFTEATKDYDVALVRGPQYFPAFLGLGEVHEWKLDYDEAKRRYLEVLEAEGKQVDPFKARANMALGQLTAMETDPRTLKEQVKGDMAAYDRLLSEQQKKTLQYLDDAINLDPDLINAYMARGRFYLSGNSFNEAAKDFKTAIQLMNKRNKLAAEFGDGSDDDIDDFEGSSKSELERRRINHSIAEGLLGLSLFNAGEKAQASNHFQSSASISKSSPLAKIGFGLLSTDKAKQAEHYKKSLQYLRSESNQIGAFFKEGKKTQQQAKESRKPEHFTRARRAFARVLFLNPWHSLAWYERGRLEVYWEKNLDGAVDDATKAIERNKYLREAYEFRGFLYAKDLPAPGRGKKNSQYFLDQAKSEQDFSAAIALGREDAEIAHAYYGRALARSKSLKSDDVDATNKALADLEAAIKKAPKEEKTAEQLRNKIKYFQLRAEVYTKINQAEKVNLDREQVQALLKRAKTKAKKFKDSAIVHQDKRRYNEAIKKFNRAIEFDPELSDAFYHRGLCYLKIGNFIPGILDFSRALELNPRYADQFYNKVYQVNYVVDLKRVMDELNKIVEERPNVSYVIFLRGFFYVAKSEFKEYEASDLDKGIADFDACLKLNTTHVTARTYRGLLFYKKKDYKTAHSDFQAALDIDDKSGITYYLKALCLATQAGEASAPEDKTAFQKRAVDCLNKAFINSFRGYDRISKDKGFENLKGYPPFERLMKNKQ
ncbi:MAG: protein kinase [Planctomycetota bacterium]|nr:protein kinase [Planctomycetota bacterium]